MTHFDNHTEAGFYDFMMSRRQHKESTVFQYIRRIRKIRPMDQLINENLDTYINDFEKGSNENMNNTNHNAYSCALKQLKKYKQHRGIITP